MKEQRNQEQKAGRSRCWGVLGLVAGFWFLTSGFLPQDTLKVDVNLINVFATVKDDRGKFVTDLTREDFRLYDDDQLQSIQIFEKQERVDSSLGILMDTSGSMVDILPFMKKGIREFTRALSPAIEFFVVSFGTNVKLIHSSTQSQKHLEDSMEVLRAYGTSLMYDALRYSIDKVETSDRPRKALIMFTDGNDNGSQADYAQVINTAQKSGVLLYFVAIGSRLLVDTHTLESLSDISGGRTLYVGKEEAVLPVLEQIHSELAQQYYLGYYKPRRSGFHRIRVEIPGRNLTVRARTGYVGG